MVWMRPPALRPARVPRVAVVRVAVQSPLLTHRRPRRIC